MFNINLVWNDVFFISLLMKKLFISAGKILN
jgi:hypothetical protein